MLDRARWEWREWRTPSNPSFIQEELDYALLHEVKWVAGARLLDVGCGSGAYCKALRERGVRTIGVDLAMASLTQARGAGISVGQASAIRLPFADATFDDVLCHKTLYLVNPPEAAAAELTRIVKPGGRLIFSTSNQTSPYMRVQAAVRQRSENSRWRTGNAWSASHWISALSRLGLIVSAIYSCNLIWPIVYRVCDTWLVPNEWMRRYTRKVRRLTGIPLRTERLLGFAQDYLIEMTRG